MNRKDLEGASIGLYLSDVSNTDTRSSYFTAIMC